MDDSEYLEFATAAAREVLLLHYSKGPPELSVALLQLLPHVFDPDVDTEALRLELGADARQALDTFLSSPPLPLSEYLEYLRYSAAVRLVEKTSLPFRRISKLVGYRRPAALAAECREWHDLKPGEMRYEARLRGEAQLDGPTPFFIIGAHCQDGLLAPRPDGEPPMAPILETRLARQLAERLVENYDGRLKALRETLAAGRICCGGSTLFNLLMRQSREAYWLDPRLSCDLAETALAAVEGSRLYLGLLGPELRVLALGWLGHLHMRFGDARRAERWLKRAERAIDRPFRRHDPQVEGDATILWLRGTLRFYADDFEAAQELLDQAVEAAEWEPEVEAKARAQRAELFCRQLRRREALHDLAKLVELRDDEHELDYEQRLWAYRTVAELALEVGEAGEARWAINTASLLSQALGDSVVTHELAWLGGLLARAEGDAAAEELFRVAWDNLAKSLDVVRTALVGIDLAMLLEEKGRGEEAAVFVECEVVRVLDRVVLLGQPCREAIDALRPGFEEGVLPPGSLRAAREALRERQMR